MAALELSDKLQKAHQEKGELLRELDASLAIQALWPEAFDKGKVVGCLSGDARREDLDKLALLLKNAAGESKTFKLDEVPYSLRRIHVMRFCRKTPWRGHGDKLMKKWLNKEDQAQLGKEYHNG